MHSFFQLRVLHKGFKTMTLNTFVHCMKNSITQMPVLSSSADEAAEVFLLSFLDWHCRETKRAL